MNTALSSITELAFEALIFGAISEQPSTLDSGRLFLNYILFHMTGIEQAALYCRSHFYLGHCLTRKLFIS